MKRRNVFSPKKRTRTPGRTARRQTLRNHEARTRGFAAINGVRKGKYKSVSTAARAEGTTPEFIKRELPGTLLPSRPGKRIRVRASDRYSQLVEILTESGPVVVTARGSRERELAGQHRAAFLGVLRNHLPASVLKRFRGKKVGGRELLSDYERLLELGRGQATGNLMALYVPPDSNA